MTTFRVTSLMALTLLLALLSAVLLRGGSETAHAAALQDSSASAPSNAAKGDPAATEATKGTVLVTGANRGIGLALARKFKAAGYTVLGTARKPDEAAELTTLGVQVLALDVASGDSVRALATKLTGKPIDILINNAGVSNRGGGLEQLDFDDVERTLAVNTIGPMRVTQALLPNLRLGSRKIVASISSRLASIELNTSGGYYGYRESKTALNQFMRTLGAELRAEGFICVALSPGWVRTDMGGSSAPLSPEESAAGLFTVIDGLAPDKTGSFLSYEGAVLPW